MAVIVEILEDIEDLELILFVVEYDRNYTTPCPKQESVSARNSLYRANTLEVIQTEFHEMNWRKSLVELQNPDHCICFVRSSNIDEILIE